MRFEIIHSDCLDVMSNMIDDCVHAIVCDPPYSIQFMSAKWDYELPSVSIWKECLRVLKPGGFLLAFSSARTYHRLACDVEDVGFVIHPLVATLAWVQGQGFPKGTDVGKKSNQKGWNGYKYGLQAIKPAMEPILVVCKPYDGKSLDSILKHEVGAYNIGACRVNLQGEKPPSGSAKRVYKSNQYTDEKIYGDNKETPQAGRYPPNVVLVHHPDCKCIGNTKVKNRSGSVSGREPSHTGDENAQCYGEFDRVPFNKYGDAIGNELIDNWECVDGCPVRALGGQSGYSETKRIDKPSDCGGNTWGGTIQQNRGPRGHTDEGTAARFFPQFQEDEPTFKYQSKASVSEREAGLKGCIPCAKCGGLDTDAHKDGKCKIKCRRNIHPTVKPIELMRWLIRLISRDDQLILDPFCGSGSTGCAAVMEGRKFLGIELDEDVVKVANARVKHWQDNNGS